MHCHLNKTMLQPPGYARQLMLKVQIDLCIVILLLSPLAFPIFKDALQIPCCLGAYAAFSAGGGAL